MEDHHLFVCTGSTCTQQGAEEVLHCLRKQLQEKGINNVCVTLVRCLDQCGNGPNMVLYGRCHPSEGVWYGNLVEAAMDRWVTLNFLEGKKRVDPQNTLVTI